VALFDAHTNFAYSSVLVVPSPAISGTTLTLQNNDGAKMPAVPFNATIWPSALPPLKENAEIVRVTNRAGDVLTITRAQESSTARAIVSGDQFMAGMTVKTFTDIEAAIGQKTYVTVGTAAGADYVCDGVADNVEIQAALDSVASAGGAVLIRSGTYFSAAQLNIASNVALLGMGRGNTIIKQSNAANVTMFRNADPTNGNSDITISNFTVDGNKANQTGGGRGVHFTNVTRPTVENVDFHDCRNRAIHYITCTNGKVSGCEGRDCGVFQEQVFTFEGCERCIYSDCYASGGTDRDFEIATSNNCELHNCISVSPLGAGIGIYSTTTPLSGVIVDGYISISPQAEGIYLERVTNSFFSNVWIYNPATEGIRDYGVLSNMADNSFSNIFIYNSAGAGITTNGTRSVFTNIKVYDPTNHGIRVTAPEMRISNCHVYNAGQNCYWIGSGANYCGISNCLGKNGGIANVGGHKNGVRLEGTNCTVSGSHFFDDQATKTQDYGIREISPTDFNNLVGNYVRGNNISGLLLIGSNTEYAQNLGY
jgi:hypothetical protein